MVETAPYLSDKANVLATGLFVAFYISIIMLTHVKVESCDQNPIIVTLVLWNRKIPSIVVSGDFHTD